MPFIVWVILTYSFATSSYIPVHTTKTHAECHRMALYFNDEEQKDFGETREVYFCQKYKINENE